MINSLHRSQREASERADEDDQQRRCAPGSQEITTGGRERQMPGGHRPSSRCSTLSSPEMIDERAVEERASVLGPHIAVPVGQPGLKTSVWSTCACCCISLF